MAVLTVQQIDIDGLAPAYAAAGAGGDEFKPGDNVFLHIKNGGVGSITATLNSVTLSNYGTDEDVAISIAAGAERMIGPVSAGRFAAADGNADVTYSGVTSVTVAALRL